MQRPRSHAIVIGLALAAGWIAAAAQETPDPERAAQLLDKPALRARYGQLRRRHATDPSFDTAAGRLAAVLARRLAESAAGDGASVTWSSIGPAPTTEGQTPTQQPRFPSDVSGRVSAIAIDTVDDSIYVGGAQGGVWKSSDDGASWTFLSDPFDSLAIGSIAIDPAAHDPGEATLYVGTGEGNGSCDSYGGVGIYKSTDSGGTWSGPFGTAEFTNRGVGSIAVDRTDPDHVLATSASGIFGQGCDAAPTVPDRGVFESTDGGATWTKRTGGNWRGSVVMQDPVTATTWWAAMWTSSSSVDPANEGGLQKSIDNGMTWVQQAGMGGLPPLATSYGRSWITGTNDGGSILYYANAQAQGTVFKSINGGGAWVVLPAATGYCGGQCFYDLPLLVEPGDSDVFYVGGAGQSVEGQLPSQFMRSTNGGVTFVDLVRSADETTALHADEHAIATWPAEPHRLWNGNDGGVWRSDDRGTNWVDVNHNLNLTQFQGCDLHPTEAVAYGGTQDNGTMGWEGSGVAWPHLDFGDGGFARIDQGNPENLVHTYFNQTGNLIGVGWTNQGFEATMGEYCTSTAPGNGINLGDRVLFYAPIHLDAGNTDTLYFGTHKLYRASNFFGTTPGSCVGAATFSALSGGMDLAPGGGALSAIETVANGSADALSLFTGSDNGHVFRSTNGGASFTEIDLGGSPLYVSDIAVDPLNPLVVYQGRSGFAGAAGLNVRKSTNGGTSWIPSGTGIPDIAVNAIEIDPARSGWVWAGTDVGPYLSTDGGANWAPAADGFPVVAIYDMKGQGATGILVACTHGRGAFLTETPEVAFADGFEGGNTDAWSQVVNN